MDELSWFVRYHILLAKYKFIKWGLEPEQKQILLELKREEKIKNLEADVVMLQNKVKQLTDDNIRLSERRKK